MIGALLACVVIVTLFFVKDDFTHNGYASITIALAIEIIALFSTAIMSVLETTTIFATQAGQIRQIYELEGELDFKKPI